MSEKEIVYALRYKKDDSKLFYSTSGGVFLGFAEVVISEGGRVYGAAYNEKNEVVHVSVDRCDDLNCLQGSKYVQSVVGLSYKNVRMDLEHGKQILFMGAPCQIAGLKAFLNKEYRNLLTIDFACHGVPSPLFFSSYLKWIENRYKEKIAPRAYIFRYKKYGWYFRRKMCYTFKFNNKVSHVSADPYYSNFLKANCYRESCYNCPFCLGNFQSDITVGDFSNVDKRYPWIMDKRGVSYAILHSAKAELYLEKAKGNFSCFKVDYDYVAQNNIYLNHRPERKSERSEFYEGLKTDPIGFIEKLDSKIGRKIKLKGIILAHFPRILAHVWSK